ncbi:MAG: GNAT family N-acetyltransferase [Polyangiales bacterium]
MGDDATYRYGLEYKETVALNDGRKVRLRQIRPDDKELILEGFEALSTESRYARFMTHKTGLNDRELRYLTEVDGVNHFAIMAVRPRMVNRQRGVGTARFVRLEDHHDTAEPAVTIVDAYHGQGLGATLLGRLLEAAWERDIRWFRSELLARNVAMKSLVASLSDEAQFRPSGDGCLVATFPVPEPERTPTEPGLFKRSALYRVLAHVAGADITVRPRVTRPPGAPE